MMLIERQQKPKRKGISLSQDHSNPNSYPILNNKQYREVSPRPFPQQIRHQPLNPKYFRVEPQWVQPELISGNGGGGGCLSWNKQQVIQDGIALDHELNLLRA